MALLGIDIGGTKCAVIKAGDDHRPAQVVRFATTNVDETLARIFAEVAALDPGESPLIGVACGSPLDRIRGIIQSPPNLPGWDEIPITQMLIARFGGEAYLMNDANAGALAEWYFGAGRGYRHVIFCTHGTGFGAGLILNGQLYEGASGDAGEVGHVRLAPDGPIGYGKAGSVEGFCSGGGIAQLAGGRSAKAVAEAAAQGDAASREILATSGRYLGQTMSLLMDLFNPEVIILGSLYARAGHFLDPEMRRVLEVETLPPTRRACTIVATELGEAIGDYAALAVALYRTNQLPAPAGR